MEPENLQSRLEALPFSQIKDICQKGRMNQRTFTDEPQTGAIDLDALVDTINNTSPKPEELAQVGETLTKLAGVRVSVESDHLTAPKSLSRALEAADLADFELLLSNLDAKMKESTGGRRFHHSNLDGDISLNMLLSKAEQLLEKSDDPDANKRIAIQLLLLDAKGNQAVDNYWGKKAKTRRKVIQYFSNLFSGSQNQRLAALVKSSGQEDQPFLVTGEAMLRLRKISKNRDVSPLMNLLPKYATSSEDLQKEMNGVVLQSNTEQLTLYEAFLDRTKASFLTNTLESYERIDRHLLTAFELQHFQTHCIDVSHNISLRTIHFGFNQSDLGKRAANNQGETADLIHNYIRDQLSQHSYVIHDPDQLPLFQNLLQDLRNQISSDHTALKVALDLAKQLNLSTNPTKADPFVCLIEALIEGPESAGIFLP